MVCKQTDNFTFKFVFDLPCHKILFPAHNKNDFQCSIMNLFKNISEDLKTKLCISTLTLHLSTEAKRKMGLEMAKIYSVGLINSSIQFRSQLIKSDCIGQPFTLIYFKQYSDNCVIVFYDCICATGYSDFLSF